MKSVKTVGRLEGDKGFIGSQRVELKSRTTITPTDAM